MRYLKEKSALVIQYADGKYRLDHAITATQKDILKAFNMNLKDVNKGAEEISEILEMQRIECAQR